MLLVTRLNFKVILISNGQRSKVKVTGHENVKIVFFAHILRKWIDLRRTKPKLTLCPVCTPQIQVQS